MSFFKSWPFAFWFVVAFLGVGAVVYAAIQYSGGDSQTQWEVSAPNNLVFEASSVVSAAIAGGETVDATVTRFSQMATENAEVLRTAGWGTLADGYEKVALYADSINSNMPKEERVWRADVLARNVGALSQGRVLVISDGEWMGLQADVNKPLPSAEERIRGLSGTLRPGD